MPSQSVNQIARHVADQLDRLSLRYFALRRAVPDERRLLVGYLAQRERATARALRKWADEPGLPGRVWARLSTPLPLDVPLPDFRASSADLLQHARDVDAELASLATRLETHIAGLEARENLESLRTLAANRATELSAVTAELASAGLSTTPKTPLAHTT